MKHILNPSWLRAGLGFFLAKLSQRKNKMIELACTDVIFHFNKKHLEDTTIPMWVLKTKGTAYYVNHVDCQMPWSTKETPDNSHTKGSLKIKHCLLTIDDNNNATLSKLTEVDKSRLRNREKGITRVMITGSKLNEFNDALKQNNIKHAPIKTLYGSCGTRFYITDILAKSHMTMLSLALDNTVFRILQENESYYKMYDDPEYAKNNDLWDKYDEDEDEEDETDN